MKNKKDPITGASGTIGRASLDENWCNPIYADDYLRQAPLLWDVAAAPATVLNWGDDEPVTQRDIAQYISEITGAAVRYEVNERRRMSCAHWRRASPAA